MPIRKRSTYYRATKPFRLDGRKQIVEVVDGMLVRRRLFASQEGIEETTCPITRAGCYIENIAASPSGKWCVTQRISGQGEWGYDLFRTRPLERVAGIAQDLGFILDVPVFAKDESFLIGAAGDGMLGYWWNHPDDEPDEPARGGPRTIGFLFVHRLPRHKVTRHELRVDVPKGWLPKDPWHGWHGPRKLSVTGKSVRLVPSWGVPVVLKLPLPKVIKLPVPHPSGKGLLKQSLP